MDQLSASLHSDEWQQFVTSDVWKKFCSSRIYGEGGLFSSINKVVLSSLRQTEFNSALYNLGMLDGISRVLTLMGSYHTELEKEVGNGR